MHECIGLHRYCAVQMQLDVVQKLACHLAGQQLLRSVSDLMNAAQDGSVHNKSLLTPWAIVYESMYVRCSGKGKGRQRYGTCRWQHPLLRLQT